MAFYDGPDGWNAQANELHSSCP